MEVTKSDPFQEYIEDPEKMLKTVSGLREAVRELPPGVRRVLKYIAKDSLDPYEPVSVVCDFISSLDKYLSKHQDGSRLARAVDWKTIVYSSKSSVEIYDKTMLERISEKMKGKLEFPGFLDMNNFIKELTEAGVIFRHQEPNSMAQYILTPEAVEALRVLDKIRKFPWSYPIQNITKTTKTGVDFPQGAKESKSFSTYKKRFLELEMNIIGPGPARRI